jgi:hypothetical protein
MLRRTTRSSLTIQNADFEAEYTESWLYKYVRHEKRTAPLTASLESEAIHVAQTSWPLSWTLARYYRAHDPSRIDQLIRQFVAIVETETNVNRLMHYRDDIAASAVQLLRQCSPETADRLTEVLLDRFMINVAELPRRREGQR